MCFCILVLKCELTDSLARSRETKPSEACRLVELSPECSRWFSGVIIQENIENPKFLLDGEVTALSRVTVTYFLAQFCFCCSGWSFHVVELMGQGKEGAQHARGKVLMFFIFGELCSLAFLASLVSQQGCSSSGCSSRSSLQRCSLSSRPGGILKIFNVAEFGQRVENSVARGMRVSSHQAGAFLFIIWGGFSLAKQQDNFQKFILLIIAF